MSRKDLRAYLSLAAILASQSAVSAAGETLPIKKISVDASKQLVVEFGGKAGSFPAVPHVLDLPGPNHRVVLDFTEAAIDKTTLPGADELSSAVAQTLPFVKSVRYSNLENAPAPTARIVLDVPEEAKFKPRVVKLEEGQITISLGDELPGAAAPTPVASSEITDPKPGETPIGAETAAAPATAGGGQLWDAVATQPAAVASAPAPASAPVDLKDVIPTDTTPSTTADTTPTTEAAAPTPDAAVATTAGSEPSGLAPHTESEPVATSAPTPAAEPGPEAMGTPVEAAPAAAAPGESGEVDKKLQSVRHYNTAVQSHLQGKLTEAITAYKASLEANPNLAEAHSNLGLIFNQQHNYAQALAEFRKALAINPKDAITYNGIGAALRAERDLAGAIKNWQTAVNLDPKLATAHYNLGTAYEIQKEYDKALDSYGSAVKNDYRLGEAYYRMGLIWERKKKLDDAASQFKEALKVSGDSEYSEDARQRLAFLEKGKKTK